MWFCLLYTSSNEFSGNAEIAVEYASGLFNLSNKQDLAGAGKTIEQLEKLFNENFSGNAEIAAVYAKGPVSYTHLDVYKRQVERSHREDQKRFYNTHRFFSLTDFAKQLAAHQNRSNDLPMRPLGWLSPKEKLDAFLFSLPVQNV